MPARHDSLLLFSDNVTLLYGRVNEISSSLERGRKTKPTSGAGCGGRRDEDRMRA